jgi:hypothetical protein
MILTTNPATQWRYFSSRLLAKQIVHFLHVSKTGGTAIKTAIDNHVSTENSAIFLHDHSFRLRHVGAGEKAVLFFRDPIARFVSAFYSRQRCGRPRYDIPWSRAEELAFTRFKTANQLGRDLSSTSQADQTAAHSAMRSIGLLNQSYYDWIESDDYFSRRGADILFIGLQEHLEDDFGTLKQLLGLPHHLRLPTNDVSAHRNPLGRIDKQLDDTARRNLAAWYARDIAFFERCLAGER